MPAVKTRGHCTDRLAIVPRDSQFLSGLLLKLERKSRKSCNTLILLALYLLIFVQNKQPAPPMLCPAKLRPLWRRTGVLLSAVLVLALGASQPSYAQQASADQTDTALRLRMVQRQNLHDATNGRAPATGSIRVGVRNNGLSSDVVVKRRQAPTVEPLIKSAQLNSEAVYVQELGSDTVLYDKNSTDIRPIASISKLMAALIVVEAGLPMDEILTITSDDVDRLRHSRSRLPVGTKLSRGDLLHLSLMSSENRAAHALGRHYPGGMPAFVRAMNDKARALGMRHTRFVEPTGLSAENVSTARDLVKLVQATAQHPLIRHYSTNSQYDVTLSRGRQLAYRNTNRLVRNDTWDIQLSKTGFINEAGECLVMLTRIDGRDVAMVLLNAAHRTRITDAVRLRSLVQKSTDLAML